MMAALRKIELRRVSYGAALRRNREKGRKIDGQKERRLREQRAISQGLIFLPQMFLPFCRATQ
jgi:hypothetical protein